MRRSLGRLRYVVIASRRTIDREEVASHYDELDLFYRDVWGEHVHHGLWRRGDESREEAVLALTNLVAQRAGLPLEVHASASRDSAAPSSGSTRGQVFPRVIDIGCGYGATARWLAARGAQVTGITVSPAQGAIAAAHAPNESNPKFLVGDWLENPLPAGSFDAAIAIESSEHMVDKARFFSQASRVLRRGGRLVICAWLAAESPRATAKRWLLEPICRECRMPHLGSATEYKALAEEAGFAQENFEDVTRCVARTWPAIVRRLVAKFATEPHYLRFLFSTHAKNRVFVLTILRIWLAYSVGAMRYGIFSFVKAS